jgi:hypothetical protein
MDTRGTRVFETRNRINVQFPILICHPKGLCTKTVICKNASVPMVAMYTESMWEVAILIWSEFSTSEIILEPDIFCNWRFHDCSNCFDALEDQSKRDLSMKLRL